MVARDAAITTAPRPRPPGFGAVHETSEVAALRRRLHARLSEAVQRLPAPLAADIVALLRRHGRTPQAPDGDVFVLFPAPVWSFLHWVPGARCAWAERAHVAVLFLHLLDDHLVDGQLPVNIARLQLRTELWRAFEESVVELCGCWGVSPAVADASAEEYLTSVHAPSEPAGLDGYEALAAAQAAMWTVVPRLLAASGRSGPELAGLVIDFAVAWRLVDDAADVVADARAGVRSAVWWELSPGERARWGEPGEEYARAAAQVLARAGARVAAAADRARTAGLTGIAVELRTASLPLLG